MAVLGSETQLRILDNSKLTMNRTAYLLARVAAANTERVRAEARLQRQFAPDFNAVALLAPGETRLSAILRWLLDETSHHGQGRLFRDRFVADLLGEDPEIWTGAIVACEVSTTDGRGLIDVLMETRDRSQCVVIENKPWAGWQTDQLARYLRDQQKRRSRVRVLALIGHDDPLESLERHWAERSEGSLPLEISAIGFADVAAWLELCASATRADKVRGFLYDLAEYCRKSIAREPTMDSIDETVKLLLSEGSDTLQAARTIAAAIPLAMTTEVARRLGASVEFPNRPVLRITIDGVNVFLSFSV